MLPLNVIELAFALNGIQTGTPTLAVKVLPVSTAGKTLSSRIPSAPEREWCCCAA